MSHPLFHIKTYYQDVNDGKYAEIGRKAAADWELKAEHYDNVGRFAAVAVERVGQLVASKARLTDKINLYKTLIADGIGYDAGGLSDDDAVMILAGWAGEMRKRFVE